MSGPESPLQRRPALRLGYYRMFSIDASSVVLPKVPLVRSPAGSVLCDAERNIAKVEFILRRCILCGIACSKEYVFAKSVIIYG